MGITPDVMKQIDYQKEMEKLIGNTAGSMADAVYQQELKRNQDMLRSAIGPSASEMAAEALGLQLISSIGFNTAGGAASAYLESQSTARADIEKALGGSMGNFLALREFRNLADLNEQARAWVQQSQYRSL